MNRKAPGVSALPIHAVLPDLLAALRAGPSAVLIAPPGAGKTTAVAPALLAEPWCTGQVIVLSPRRVAARAAAERMAELLDEDAGGTVGYVTRLDAKRSARTRVLVVTEAIFVSTILNDPELQGVSAVLFDEAHERHLDSDLGLALAVEAQGVLREDLRIVVMSATIDGSRFAALLGDAPVVESEGKAHPLTVKWLGARPDVKIEAAMASAIQTAWREEEGDILAFLPGVAQIERTADVLSERLPQALVLPLHGQVEPAGQRAAIRRDAQGRRRIVLATSIAETSLTLDGVSVVVDAGLSRRAEFDKAAGVTRLVTTRASQASAAQRAGRAARQGPGVAYRLWEEAAHAGRAAFDPPEVVTSDLAPLALTLAQWGAGDVAGMAWLDPPPVAAMAAARGALVALGAVDLEGRITAHGRAMARLPMEPALAHMLLFAAERGQADEAARLALLLQERGLGGRGEDLAQRLERWDRERGGRAEGSRKLAGRWAELAVRVLRQAQHERGSSSGSAHPEPVEGCKREVPLGVLLAEAFPDRIARARSATGEEWLSSGGRGYRLDAASSLATAKWLVIGDAQGEAKGARITAAIALTDEEVTRHVSHRIEERHALTWNASEGRVEARLERRLGAIVLARVPDPKPDAQAVAAKLIEVVREGGLGLLPLGDAAKALIVRAGYAGLEAFSEGALLDGLEQWLGPLLTGRRDLEIGAGKLHEALANRLDWNEKQALDRLAPAEFRSPAGTSHAIDYGHEGGPCVELRVQALFGLDRHPCVGQPPRPLLLSLTSPGAKPIQTTADLPGFWRGSWRDVVKDMKGRYPRHRWPDEPWAEDPSLKTKNAFNAQKRT
ncbi:MAG: ATP-dependent helicase HrpB [Novosphingobium sp. 28-62-57]|uniref:ATP-dependent helicase HrpB n=1 Tax=unclassified Novosphingobium TaxID=2644732 RepID=UPI000BD895DA|nr:MULTISPECIES: ATP-dependent helicase HrpB [unclassified Novosphingobium]OYW50915.1 MAG: ATP-dependent helicase HrpB [Novosphingobium sp. 12-62-10]OYZ09947.1 MAG: ATP-dependent helicase HrpB [Novosphingobium sp. 28-62-57]OZA36549.1 MAG: ATP-dependent helicase HrpB [Novosphingobium sp. 17-62-9]